MTNKSEKTKTLLLEHYRAYPELKLRDVFKYLYQSSFGCEHLVTDTDAAIAYIASEYETLRQEPREIEPLDGEYSRVPLSYMNKGITAESLGKLFVLSAKREENGLTELAGKLKAVRELVSARLLPFTEKEYDEAVSEWEELGYPTVRHSEEFREKYRPSYRVIANEYIPLLPIFAELDKLNGKATVAIEGGSASGKTTLAALLERVYGCTVFHMDDYFLPMEKRTSERYEEVGGNVDYERFLSEILDPISRGDKVKYRRFDCRTMSLGDEIEVDPQKLVIVEGAYSMHPTLENQYDLSVYLDITPDCQKKRITGRNSPEMAERFFYEWIPLENIYFEKTNIKERCSMTIKICDM